MVPRALRPASLLAALALAPIVLEGAPAGALSGVPAGVEALLGAVGTLGGVNAYATFMAIGAVADGWVRETYDADTAVRVVGVLKTLVRSAADSLEELIRSGVLREDDRVYLRGVTEVYGRLEAEAASFVVWVQTGERRSFDEARAMAWKTILDTLALPREEALE